MDSIFTKCHKNAFITTYRLSYHFHNSRTDYNFISFAHLRKPHNNTINNYK